MFVYAVVRVLLMLLRRAGNRSRTETGVGTKYFCGHRYGRTQARSIDKFSILVVPIANRKVPSAKGTSL